MTPLEQKLKELVDKRAKEDVDFMDSDKYTMYSEEQIWIRGANLLLPQFVKMWEALEKISDHISTCAYPEDCAVCLASETLTEIKKELGI